MREWEARRELEALELDEFQELEQVVKRESMSEERAVRAPPSSEPL